MDDAEGRSSAHRILVLGGMGMLGHRLVRDLCERFAVAATVRDTGPDLMRWPPIQESAEVVGGVDAIDIATVVHSLDTVKPDVVINCIGIVKQSPTAADPIASIRINSLFPHRLSALCAERQNRLIHISTDCVFSGASGNSSETDNPDPVDLYGRSKLLGEVTGPGVLTVRTSMIGRELRGDSGLLEWFLSQHHTPVNGYTRAVFSGLTTAALARVIADIVSEHPALEGLMHVASEPITKFDLLSMVNNAMGLGAEIQPVDEPVIDRSLDGSRFVAATGIRSPSWDKMIEELANDPTPYDQWRTQHGST